MKSILCQFNDLSGIESKCHQCDETLLWWNQWKWIFRVEVLRWHSKHYGQRKGDKQSLCKYQYLKDMKNSLLIKHWKQSEEMTFAISEYHNGYQ